MRNFFAICLVLSLTGPVMPAMAAEPAPAKLQKHPTAPEDRLDELFCELKRERNEKAAERIAQRIGEEWIKSGSASIDLMMLWAKTAMDAKKFDVALDFLDQVVTLSPTYAEGWNRRATVHFMMQNYRKSMADIDQTLQLEPRHFGALVGHGADHEEHRPNRARARSLAARARHLSDDAQRPERGRHDFGRTGRRRHLTAPPARLICHFLQHPASDPPHEPDLCRRRLPARRCCSSLPASAGRAPG